MFVDTEGIVDTSSNGDTISFTMESNSTSYAAKYNAGTHLRSTNGVFNLTEITFVGEPGTEVTLLITSTYINGDLELADSNYSLNVPISFRPCISGEEFTGDGQCVRCAP